MFNPSKIFKLKNAWNVFSKNHPKFPQFLNAIHKSSIAEGTIIEINVISSSGKTISSNVKLVKTDIDLFQELSEALKQ